MLIIRFVAVILKTLTLSTSTALPLMSAIKSQFQQQAHSASYAMEELLAIHSSDASTAPPFPMEQEQLLAQFMACAIAKLAILSTFG